MDSELSGKSGSKGSRGESLGIQKGNGICLEHTDTGDSFIMVMHDVAGPWVKVTWCCIKSDVCNSILVMYQEEESRNVQGWGCFTSHFAIFKIQVTEI